MSESEKKIEFIITWYRKVRIRFSFQKQMLLAKTWMDICTKNEEYEMAAALKKEKQRLAEIYLNKKRKNRTYKEIIKFYILKLKRKYKKKTQ